MHGYFICLFNSILPTVFSSDIEVWLLSPNYYLLHYFQLFDGTQVVAIGALRGLEDYKYPTYIAFIGYWLISVCYLFAFVMDYKVYGVWLALALDLDLAIALSFRIRNLIRLKSISG